MEDRKSSREYLFRVTNGHSESCGVPPSIDGDTPGHRYSYFQNEYGEQFIFAYSVDGKRGSLWMGDAGWERSFDVVDGFVPELALSETEFLWLAACWKAATGQLPTASKGGSE